MQLQDWISQYGYITVFLGVMIEGESILLAAAYAIQQHYLQLWPVVACAALGAMVIDHIYFNMGRSKGMLWLEQHERVRHRAAIIKPWIARYQWWFLLSLRFLIGLRTVTPMLLGMSGITSQRFFWANLVGAWIWAMLVTLAGRWIIAWLHQWWLAPHHEYHLFWGLMMVAVLLAVIHVFWMKKQH